MAGYQFARIETYARSPSALRGARRAVAGQKRAKGTGGWSARQVLAEALREPGACPHVDQAQQPEVLLGDLAELARKVDELERDPPAGQRRDTPILMAGVLSAPWPPGDERGIEWRMDAMEWLRGKWGDRLQVVVAHNDESHDHMHWYVTAPGWGSVKGLHPGMQARKEAATEGEAGKGQKAAFTAAMQAFQDEYHTEVASKHGMARIGPARRRLTREAWNEQQQQAEALAEARKRAKATDEAAQRAMDVARARVAKLRLEETEGYAALAREREELARERARLQELAASLSPIEEERAAALLAKREAEQARLRTEDSEGLRRPGIAPDARGMDDAAKPLSTTPKLKR